MTPEVARWIIEIRADAEVQARLDELADKNTEGVITPEELAVYDDYLLVADLVGVMQSQARAALARSNGH